MPAESIGINQWRSQKSRQGCAAVLFDIARIRKGVLELHPLAYYRYSY